MPVKPKARKPADAARGDASSSPTRSAASQYDAIRTQLEKDHFGAYVMINTATGEYVVAPTTSQAHAQFIERFGESAPGWCTRIGASVLATA